MIIYTVGELIKKLSSFPDDMDVILLVTINNADMVYERSIKSMEILNQNESDDYADAYFLNIVSGKDMGERCKIKELIRMLSVVKENTIVGVNSKNIENVNFWEDRNKKKCCAFEVW